MSESLYPAAPILLVDDEPAWLHGLSLILERSAGASNLRTCGDSRQVMDILRRQRVSLILLDLTMPHLSGETLLVEILRDFPEIPVIINSGRNQADIAVRCMKAGAFDYFVKSVEEERLVAGVRRALAMSALRRENQALKNRVLHERLEHPEAFSAIRTCSREMQALFRYIEAVAGSSEPVLITGESGVGKELAARAVHQIGRPKGPWIALNAAGLDDNVFADTLFGHTRGAFTGADRPRPGMIEEAAAGTLFLDEIGDLPPASQVKLLRLLQEGEFLPLGSDRPRRSEARIVVATNQDLGALQAAGRFRKDLFYRLCAHQVQLPPLRERSDDIPLLLDHFLEEAAQALGRRKPTPPPELAVLLATYFFPGNLRELRAMVFDAVSTHRGGILSMDAFKKNISTTPASAPGESVARGTTSLDFGERMPTLEEAGRMLVSEAMRRARGNQTLAASLLGISRPALSKRLKKAAGETP